MWLVAALLLGLVCQQVEGRIWGGSKLQKTPTSVSSGNESPVKSIMDFKERGFESESVMASDWFSMDPFNNAGWGASWPKSDDRPKIEKLTEVPNLLRAKGTQLSEGGQSKDVLQEFEIVPNLTEASELKSVEKEKGGNSENWKTLKSGTFSSKVKSGGKLTNLKLHKSSSGRPENSKPEILRVENAKPRLEKINAVRRYLRKVCQSTRSRDVVELCKEMQIDVQHQQPSRKFHPSQLLTIDWRQVVSEAMKKRNQERQIEIDQRVAAAKETENHLFFHSHGFKRRKGPPSMVDSLKGALMNLISRRSGRGARKKASPWEEKHSLKKSFRISSTSPGKEIQPPNRIAKVSGTKRKHLSKY